MNILVIIYLIIVGGGGYNSLSSPHLYKNSIAYDGLQEIQSHNSIAKREQLVEKKAAEFREKMEYGGLGVEKRKDSHARLFIILGALAFIAYLIFERKIYQWIEDKFGVQLYFKAGYSLIMWILVGISVIISLILLAVI